MIHFSSEYRVTLDAKGRFLLPVDFRRQIPEGLGTRFVVTKGIDKHLILLTTDVWQKINKKINLMNDMSPDVRDFRRLVSSPATTIEVDNGDRIMIPKTLLDKCNITKDMVMVPAGYKMELWNQETYDTYQKNWDNDNFFENRQQQESGISKLAREIMEKYGNPFDISDDE